MHILTFSSTPCIVQVVKTGKVVIVGIDLVSIV